jgi:mycothiol system anti-sigma-R factor
MGSPEVGCGPILAHLWPYIDQEMDAAACVQLEMHLRDCATCRFALEADRNLKALVRRCSQVEPIPADRVQALLVRVRQSLSISVTERPPAD